MATINFSLDKRGKGPLYALKARAIAGRGVDLLFPVGMKLRADQWLHSEQQAVAQRASEGKLVAQVNLRLAELRLLLEQAEQDLLMSAEGLTADSLSRLLNPNGRRHRAAGLTLPTTLLDLPGVLRLRANDQRGKESPATTKAYERLAERCTLFAKSYGVPATYLRIYAPGQQPQLSGALLLRLRDWLLTQTAATNDTVNNGLLKIKAGLRHVARRYPEQLGGEEGSQRALLLREQIDLFPGELPDLFLPTEAEVLHLLAADCPEALRLGRDRWLLSAGTGLRHSDLTLAQRRQLRATPEGDIDLHYLPKKNQRRQATIIPLGDAALEIIRYWQAVEPELELLIPQQDNRRDNEQLHEWLRICGPASLHETVIRRRYRGASYVDEHLPRWQVISFHSARHFYAMSLTQAGADVRLVQNLLGQRSTASALRYARGQNLQSAQQGRLLLTKNLL